jgi:molybdopterin-guanine dinucleotide biosynthesis protein A
MNPLEISIVIRDAPMNKSMITAALMAGGKSTRMGRDKCLIYIHGVPMWQRQMELLSALSQEVFVVAPDRPLWLPDNARWIPDSVRDVGPIGGLAAALTHATYPNVLVLAVDMPSMTADFLGKLSQLTDARSGIVPQIGDRHEPLAAIYPREALPFVKDQLFIKKDGSLQMLLDGLIRAGLMRSYSGPSSEINLFRNLNSPSDCIP